MAGGPSRSPALIRKPFWRSLLVRRWSGHTRGFDKTVPDLAGVLRGVSWGRMQVSMATHCGRETGACSRRF
ncbi:hypothetical protein WJX74_000730 [Apatococcus lobatus]|uniref:Uncharacterized protein n=1 Tax=Apatococcus lobatus TaxID=904363 RepID=A0AAW1QA92_9CHLO